MSKCADMDKKSIWQLLGLRCADVQDMSDTDRTKSIKEAFRTLILRVHPDKNKGDDRCQEVAKHVIEMRKKFESNELQHLKCDDSQTRQSRQATHRPTTSRPTTHRPTTSRPAANSSARQGPQSRRGAAANATNAFDRPPKGFSSWAAFHTYVNAMYEWEMRNTGMPNSSMRNTGMPNSSAPNRRSPSQARWQPQHGNRVPVAPRTPNRPQSRAATNAAAAPPKRRPVAAQRWYGDFENFDYDPVTPRTGRPGTTRRPAAPTMRRRPAAGQGWYGDDIAASAAPPTTRYGRARMPY